MSACNGASDLFLIRVAVHQVEAGLDDLRAAYAELHQQLDSGGKPPEEKERIAQHVSSKPGSSTSSSEAHCKNFVRQVDGIARHVRAGDAGQKGRIPSVFSHFCGG